METFTLGCVLKVENPEQVAFTMQRWLETNNDIIVKGGVVWHLSKSTVTWGPCDDSSCQVFLYRFTLQCPYGYWNTSQCRYTAQALCTIMENLNV